MNANNLKHTNDQDLLDQYNKSHDKRLLGILLQRYTMLLLGVCMKYLKNEEAAKDGVQQIFLKVIHEIDRHQVQYFKSWLYMIARNYCLMQLRKQGIKYTAEISENIVDEQPAIHSPQEKEALLTLVEQSLGELTQDQKTCITLFYLEKKSYKEITEQTGFNLMKVKSYIQNGKRNLRLLVEKKLRDQK